MWARLSRVLVAFHCGGSVFSLELVVAACASLSSIAAEDKDVLGGLTPRSILGWYLWSPFVVRGVSSPIKKLSVRVFWDVCVPCHQFAHIPHHPASQHPSNPQVLIIGV